MTKGWRESLSEGERDKGNGRGREISKRKETRKEGKWRRIGEEDKKKR